MTLGMAHRQDILEDVAEFFERVLPEKSIHALLHRERDQATLQRPRLPSQDPGRPPCLH